MKTLKNILPLLLAFFAFAGCSDDLTYTKGEQENSDCYGVYFPKKQTTKTNLEFEPGSTTSVTYTVKRRNVVDPITVPLVVTANEENIFAVEPLTFEAGEEQSTLTVNFPNAQMGKTYTCNITVEDPLYASVYGKDNTNLSLSLVLAKWEKVTNGEATTGLYRDDILGNFYSLASEGFNPTPEVKVEIFERSDKKGYYRMKAYTQEFITAFAGGPVQVECKDAWTYVDATDPNKVFFPYQGTGLTLVANSGETYFASSVPENFSLDASAGQYGTLKDGIITFPAQSIVVEWPNSPDAGKFYYANNNGMQRILMPGAKVYDYSVRLSKGEPKDGAVEIEAQMGEHAAKLRYAFFFGKLSEGEAMMKAQDLDAGKLPADKINEITASGTITASNLAEGTGVYTLVGCIYDAKNTLRGFTNISFGYIAKGEEYPVVLNLGLEATNEFAGMGITTDNSAKFYAFGENIESIKYGLFVSKKIAGADLTATLKKSGADFTAEQLKEVNDGHFSQMLTNLNGDTEYTFAALAYNGFVSKLFTATIKTTGKYNPGLESSFVYEDFLPVNQQPTKEQLIATKWNYYATNIMDEKPMRKKLGVVTISDTKDNAEDDKGADLLLIEGLSGVTFDEGGAIPAAYAPSSNMLRNSGMFGAISPRLSTTPIGKIDGQEVITGCVAEEDPENVYALSYPFLGGAVADGYIYFVPTPAYKAQANMTFRYMFTGSSNTVFSMLTDMLLVDPAKDMGGIPSAVSERMAKMHEKARQMATPKNFVELPAFAASGETSFEQTPENLAQGFIPASAPQFKVSGADVAFTHKTELPAGGSAVEFTMKKTDAALLVRK